VRRLTGVWPPAKQPTDLRQDETGLHPDPSVDCPHRICVHG
jgi:hypothetical protein